MTPAHQTGRCKSGDLEIFYRVGAVLFSEEICDSFRSIEQRSFRVSLARKPLREKEC